MTFACRQPRPARRRAAAAARPRSTSAPGCSTTTAAATCCADRLAPLVVERGFGSFLDYYYLLKYDDAGRRGVAPGDGRAVGARKPTSGGRSIRSGRCVARVRAGLSRRGRAGRSGSGACLRHRRRAADHRDGARGSRLVRSRADRDSRQRRAARRRSPRRAPAATASASFRALPPALREKYFVGRRRDACRPVAALRARITSWSVVNLMRPRRRSRRSRAAPIVFCRNVFIYFSPQSIKRVVDDVRRR